MYYIYLIYRHNKGRLKIKQNKIAQKECHDKNEKILLQVKPSEVLKQKKALFPEAVVIF